ncbi:MAG: hypothetical protein EOM25_10950 [Deltaproteobacteria bacterium]|nr:hypothetical protein [Deltaproteobacteria bacterium]
MPVSFEVASVYTDPRGHVGAQEIVWLYERQGKKITVRDKNEAVGTTVFLYPDDRGRLREAQVVLAVRGKDRVLNFSFDPEKPALVPDSLPPADFLNVLLDSGDWPREYSVREEVAGVAFASTLRLIREELTLDQAMDEGFIRAEDTRRFDDQMFWVYRVINVSAGPEEEEILMQVWPKNGSFWIFEAAPHRSSHFIFKD